MIETKIYVGLNDGETLNQKYETSRYIDLLKKVCYSYHTAFSVSISNGGYFHESGAYTDETSLILSLIDVSEDTVKEIARDLCAFFNQESVLVTRGEINAYFISEKISQDD